MARQMVFTVAYFSADVNPAEHIVLVKDVFDV